MRRPTRDLVAALAAVLVVAVAAVITIISVASRPTALPALTDAQVSVAFSLTQPDAVAGTLIQGALTVINRTGKPITFCPRFTVRSVTGSAAITQPPRLPEPPCRFSVRGVPGSGVLGRFDVGIDTTYTACATSDPTAIDCLGRPQPHLPAGRYRVSVALDLGPTHVAEQGPVPTASLTVPPPNLPLLPDVSTRLVVSATQVRGGTPVAASLVIRNASGKPIPYNAGCGAPYDVAVSNARLGVQWPDHLGSYCEVPKMLPTGTSTFAATVSTRYAGCGGSSGIPCATDGPAPLPPGRYQLLVQAWGLPIGLPEPLPVTITLT